MSTASAPSYTHAKYRTKSMDDFDDLLSSSPSKFPSQYCSSPSSSSPIFPRVPGLASVTPLSSCAELSSPLARIQTSPGLDFEIGLHDVEDYNGGVSPVWSPFRHNGTSKSQGVQRQRITTNVELPSFRASFSPSDDSEPPLTSDFDVSEYSEDMDVDLVDTSDDEGRGKHSSYAVADGESTDDEEIDVIDDYHKPGDVLYSTSAQRGLAPKLIRHDSAALRIADILLQFHDQPRHAKSDDLELSRRGSSPRPDLAIVPSEECPAGLSHNEGYKGPLSPLSPLPPSSPAMSPMSIQLDLPMEESVLEACDFEPEGSVVPLDPLPSLPSSLSKPSQVMSVQMLLQHEDPDPMPLLKVVEDDPKPAPAAKQPLANKQNQPHPGSQVNAISSRSAAMDLDIGTSDLSTFATRAAASTDVPPDVEAMKKEAKAKAVGTSVKVTKVVRVKRREPGEKPRAKEGERGLANNKSGNLRKSTHKGSSVVASQEKRKGVATADGLKKKIRVELEREEDEGEARKKKRVKREADAMREAEIPLASSVEPRKRSEATPEMILKEFPKTEEKPVGVSKSPEHLHTSSSPQASSSKTTPEPPEESNELFSSEMEGLLIETFAMSRASSMPPFSLYKAAMQSRPALRVQLSKDEWIAKIETVLANARERCGVFERVESSGKDNSDRPLEAQWFYVPERDEDQERAELIRSMMPRLEKRKETRKYKQYYWQPLDKMSKWDPEDEM